MRIIIHSVPTDILVQTVSLVLNRDDPDSSSLFRCYHCGTVICRIKGSVVKISAGLRPHTDVTVLYQCYNCKDHFTFQTVRMTSDFTILSLSPVVNNTVSTFHCYTCRTQLLQYNNDKAVLLPQMTVLNPPSLFDCFKPDCKQKYLLNEVASLVV